MESPLPASHALTKGRLEALNTTYWVTMKSVECAASLSERQGWSDMEPTIHNYDPAEEYFFREGCFINELSNSASDPQLSIARVRVRPGEQTRWHVLDDREERYVIIRGTGEVEVGNLNATTVTENDVVIIPAGCRQRIRNTGSGELVFMALCTPRFIEGSYRELDSDDR
jgi:mannose-6-phosphate isomerase-like protein (cupin superfamily)